MCFNKNSKKLAAIVYNKFRLQPFIFHNFGINTKQKIMDFKIIISHTAKEIITSGDQAQIDELLLNIKKFMKGEDFHYVLIDEKKNTHFLTKEFLANCCISIENKHLSRVTYR